MTTQIATIAEADAEAKRRWGPAMFARVNDFNGLLEIVYKTQLKEVTGLLGWGHSWEDALELAETRSEWQHPPQVVRSKQPEQLGLFEAA